MKRTYTRPSTANAIIAGTTHPARNPVAPSAFPSCGPISSWTLVTSSNEM